MSDKISQAIRSSSNYCKLPDGTLIQWISGVLNEWMGSFGFPLPFIDTNFVVCASDSTADGNRYAVSAAPANNAAVYVYGQVGLKVNIIAIGRWK